MYFVHPQINLKSVFFSFFKGDNLDALREKLSFYFPKKQVVFTDMGRTAFKVIIEQLNLKNSEILFPAYTCNIFYPILKQYNIKPIFLEIDLKTFQPRDEEVSRKITPNTKAILVCHTYGLPIDVKKIREVVGERIIIEDCAHSFGAATGNSGDASLFSLYKHFPSSRGGLLVCPRDWKVELPKTSFNFRDFISLLNCFSPFAFLFRKFGQKIAPKMLRREKMIKPAAINSVSLSLFSHFFEQYKKGLKNRIELALFFQEELKKLGFDLQESKDNVFCYLSALVPKNLEKKRDKMVKELRKYHIFSTRIWHVPIILDKEVQKEYKIDLNEFPNTIEVAKRIINFPLQSYYTKKDVKKITNAVRKVIKEI